MQTFLPHISIVDSVKCLDSKRLNKQILECYQIIRVLNNETEGYKNHPAVLMWKGYEQALLCYAITCCCESENRFNRIHNTKDKLLCYIDYNSTIVYPKWFGNDKFHESHRSNLYRKDSVYYKQFKQDYDNTKAYCWPIEIDGKLIMRYKVAGEKKYL